MTTILVVEDDPTLAELLQVILEEEDYSVHLAEDGQAALAHLAAQPPDLVLSDVMLPHLDGRELWHRMQVEPRYAPIPVILMSAVRSLAPAQELGEVPFLQKPFDVDHLLSCIGQMLSPAKSTEAQLA